MSTGKRAKRLEIKHVLVPDARRELVEGAPAPEDEGERERWELDLRELYVAVTRARDGLWVGVVK